MKHVPPDVLSYTGAGGDGVGGEYAGGGGDGDGGGGQVAGGGGLLAADPPDEPDADELRGPQSTQSVPEVQMLNS